MKGSIQSHADQIMWSLFGKKRKKAPSDQREIRSDIVVEFEQFDDIPELKPLFIHPSDVDIQHALASWSWVGLDQLRVIAVSAFGDLFFKDNDGAIHQLDSIEGRLLRAAENLPDFKSKLRNVEQRDKLLLAGLIVSAKGRGLTLENGECYDFKIAPVLGGAMNVDELQIMSFVVKLDIAGQLHQQLHDLPPGTRIDKITISE